MPGSSAYSLGAPFLQCGSIAQRSWPRTEFDGLFRRMGVFNESGASRCGSGEAGKQEWGWYRHPSTSPSAALRASARQGRLLKACPFKSEAGAELCCGGRAAVPARAELRSRSKAEAKAAERCSAASRGRLSPHGRRQEQRRGVGGGGARPYWSHIARVQIQKIISKSVPNRERTPPVQNLVKPPGTLNSLYSTDPKPEINLKKWHKS